MNLSEARDYFMKRVRELKLMASLTKFETPWVFLCAASLIDCLSKMVVFEQVKEKMKKETEAKHFEAFVTEWLSNVDPRYMAFEFRNGKTDLPTQMYSVSRCGIIHAFSMSPDDRGLKAEGRRRSIVLCHRNESLRENLPHLSLFPPRNNIEDAAVFVAEDLIDDLEEVIVKVFDEAGMPNGEALRRSIESRLIKSPPLMGGF